MPATDATRGDDATTQPVAPLAAILEAMHEYGSMASEQDAEKLLAVARGTDRTVPAEAVADFARHIGASFRRLKRDAPLEPGWFLIKIAGYVMEWRERQRKRMLAEAKHKRYEHDTWISSLTEWMRALRDRADLYDDERQLYQKWIAEADPDDVATARANLERFGGER